MLFEVTKVSALAGETTASVGRIASGTGGTVTVNVATVLVTDPATLVTTTV